MTIALSLKAAPDENFYSAHTASMERLTRDSAYRPFLEKPITRQKFSLEELDEKMEQDAREEEADNIVLAEDKRVQD